MLNPAFAHRPSWRSRLAHLPRDARDTLFLLLLIGWCVLPQAGHLPYWCSIAFVLILVWRGMLAARGGTLPRRRWLVALLLAAMAATWATWGTLAGVDAGVTLLVALLALKTLELRVRRDALVIFFLGFFSLLTNFFRSQSLLTALVMLLGLLGLITALVHAHRPVGEPRLRDSARIAAKLMLAGAPVMIALFLFFPRVAPLWAIPSQEAGSRSGLSRTMAVGQVAKLALDDSIALRVRFFGAAPPRDSLYFRGPVLSRFDGREWTARGGAEDFPPFSGPPVRDLQATGQSYEYEVTLEPNEQRWLLALDATPQPPQLPAHWRAHLSGELQWVTNRPVTQLLRYRAESFMDFSYGKTGWGGRRPPDLNPYLMLPAGFNPRTLELARNLREQAGADPVALVQAALARLRTGDYRYTLEPGVAGRDTADAFWFQTRAGFCEHIASAFAILMRASGVPARIVAGFQGGELNPLDGYWIVRNSDAHAWTEVWLPGQGWVRVDPTGVVAPDRIGALQRLHAPTGLVGLAIGRFSPALLIQLRAAWDAVNNRWNQWVLNYTEERQFKLLEQLGFSQPDWKDLVKVLGMLLAAAALAAAAWTRLQQMERDPWLQLVERARRRLRKQGLQVSNHATPRQMAERLEGSGLPPSSCATLCAWLLALEHQRYARPRDAKQSLGALAREFRHVPWPHKP